MYGPYREIPGPLDPRNVRHVDRYQQRAATATHAICFARVAGLRPTAVNTVLGEVRTLQAEGRSLVSLMRGQPDTPTPPHIVEAARRAPGEGRTGYPDNQGEPGLRQAVAAKLARDNALT